MNLSITWDTSAGINSYGVQYKLSSASTWSAIAYTLNNFYSFTGLSNCTHYDFQITPYCGIGDASVAGASTVTSGFYTNTGNCNQYLMNLQVYNESGAGNDLNIVKVSNDLGVSFTYPTPISAGNNYNQSESLTTTTWFTNNFYLTLNFTGSGTSSVFYLTIYRNGVLENTGPLNTYYSGMIVPISLLTPPNNTDIIKIALNIQ